MLVWDITSGFSHGMASSALFWSLGTTGGLDGEGEGTVKGGIGGRRKISCYQISGDGISTRLQSRDNIEWMI